MPGILNGLGYHDGRLYASRLRTNTVIEIDLVGGAVAIVDSFDVSGMPGTQIDAGDVRPGTSEYYVYRRLTSQMYRISLDDREAPAEAVPLEHVLNTTDFAFFDDQIVGFDKSRNRLYEVDPETGAIDKRRTELRTTFYPGSYQADSLLYFYNDKRKEIYEVDPETGDVLSSFATPFAEPTRQIDAASCPPPEPPPAACQPLLDLRGDVLALALPQAVEEDLLADLDVALFNCSRGQYTLTAIALLDFLADVDAAAGVGIDVSDSVLLTTLTQSIISGLPEDNPQTQCSPILGLRADVLDLDVSPALEDALLADVDSALRFCGSGLTGSLLAALNGLLGTVTANTGLGGELSLLEATALLTNIQAVIALFPLRTAALLADTDARVYPNPATSQVTIETPRDVDVRVYDVVGRLVMRESVEAGTVELDVARLSAGLYVVHLASEGAVQVVRLTLAR